MTTKLSRLTRGDIKRLAKAYATAHLGRSGVKIQHSYALNAVSRAYSFPNWITASASLPDDSPGGSKQPSPGYEVIYWVRFGAARNGSAVVPLIAHYETLKEAHGASLPDNLQSAMFLTLDGVHLYSHATGWRFRENGPLTGDGVGQNQAEQSTISKAVEC